MYDLIIRGADICDGTGAPPFQRRHRDQRRPDRRARRGDAARRGASCDADGLVAAPGFIDVHTHYDCQVSWDPALTPVVVARRHHRS